VAAPAAQPRTRADAVRNYERVVAAASEVLTEKGIEAAIPEIAARAGVGKGTVYRCFPTKEHLVGAVVAERLREFTRLAEEAVRCPDPWRAFCDLLAALAERQSADHCLVDGMATASARPEVAAEKARMHDALERLIERAQCQGAMRHDVTTEDVRVLFAGIARVLRADGNGDPAAWRRYAGLVADALRV
jgi:AcrR family transcriptional regulator